MFPPTWRLAPPGMGTVLTPTTPRGPKILAVFAVKTFIEDRANMAFAVIAFDAHTLPATLRVAPPPVVPTPTNPVVP